MYEANPKLVDGFKNFIQITCNRCNGIGTFRKRTAWSTLMTIRCKKCLGSGKVAVNTKTHCVYIDSNDVWVIDVLSKDKIEEYLVEIDMVLENTQI